MISTVYGRDRHRLVGGVARLLTEACIQQVFRWCVDQDLVYGFAAADTELRAQQHSLPSVGRGMEGSVSFRAVTAGGRHVDEESRVGSAAVIHLCETVRHVKVVLVGLPRCISARAAQHLQHSIHGLSIYCLANWAS